VQTGLGLLVQGQAELGLIYKYTVYLVIFLPKILYIHHIYIWFWPTLAKMNACSAPQADHHYSMGL
jgi:hypothetical protein